MIWQLDLLLFVILVVLAMLALNVRSLMAAVAILTAFSLVVALMFAGMAAVDVAFVEVVLGAGLTGLLLVILLRRAGHRTPEVRRSRGRLAILPLIIAFAAAMIFASGGLPDRGDPEAPAHVHISPVYLETAIPETRTPNVVTAILADFRSIDTLGEVLVILTAGMAVVVILARRDGETTGVRALEPSMVGEYPGQVVRLVCVVMAPAIMLFGFFVIAHGHYGPGGGFAGGIIIGVGVILLRLTVSLEQSHRWFPPVAARLAGPLGVLAFATIGLVPMAFGGEFLDYAAFQFPTASAADMRYLGILAVEVAVGAAVAGVMVALFDSLAQVEEHQ